MTSPIRADRPTCRQRPLRIAMCLHDLRPLRDMMTGRHAPDGTFVVQAYVADGILSRGHQLTFLAQKNLRDTECTTDLQRPAIAPVTWSGHRWFDVAERAAWRAQRSLGVPYLNVFSNYRLLDACLRCLAGHDVVYERNALYTVGYARACKQLGLPYVVFFEADQLLEHDVMGVPIGRVQRWRASQLLRFNLRAADCIICVSEPAKRHLIDRWQPDPGKVVVCANGVDVQRFKPAIEARSDIRATLGLEADPLLLFVGSFFEWQDVKTLLEACAAVFPEYPRARLVLVGEGRQRQAMMQHAEDLNLSDAVCFTGLVSHDDVARLLSAADIAVAPYPAMNRELWLSPLKLFEYMASGNAIVGSRVGQLAEVLADGQNGLLVPPGDPAAMARALRALMADPHLRSRLGVQARRDAVEKHSWAHYVDRLERLLFAVVERRPVSGI